MNPQCILFDYGGTLDTNGDHWAQVIWRAYQRHQVPCSETDFLQAYIYAERTLGRNPIITPHTTFQKMLDIKLRLQLQHLIVTQRRTTNSRPIAPSHQSFTSLHTSLLNDLYHTAKNTVAESRNTLLQLSRQYPLALVSNFYGNIHTVLQEFNLLPIFQVVVESAVEGYRKPDTRLLQIAIQRMNSKPQDTLVVGDSFDKDIIPAQSIGCRTAWVKGMPWQKSDNTSHHLNQTAPDFTIHSVAELLNIL